MKHLLLLLVVIGLTACSSLQSQSTRSSSLVDFLYPQGSRPAMKPQMPLIRLPARVGLAFVPGDYRIPEAEKQALLDRVKREFEKHSFIEKIEVIPDNYLRKGGGFTLLQQVGRLYGVEQIALVSYDQVLTSRENNASLLYWTIVGLYLVPGNSNSVQTFVDTAVFDIDSRKLLFRAPGIDRSQRLSTAVGVAAVKERSSVRSFERAVDDIRHDRQPAEGTCQLQAARSGGAGGAARFAFRWRRSRFRASAVASAVAGCSSTAVVAIDPGIVRRAENWQNTLPWRTRGLIR
jgi:rhombotail lipoprotein